jgi:hypothetical protein
VAEGGTEFGIWTGLLQKWELSSCGVYLVAEGGTEFL